jgi:cytochrome c biogenesis protein
MTATAPTASRALRPGGLDPLRGLWKLLTNVKFALLLVSTAGFAAFLGVVLPQLPGPMRENAAARSAWLELRRDDFGLFTGAMDRAGLFDIFHAAWFNGLWMTVITAVTVCAVSRFRPTWRSVQRPAKQVGERYFETAHHRADYSHPGGAAAVESALRRRHYRVERTNESGGAVFLFAERFAWSSYGTFVSHLALLMLLVGALLTRLAGFDETLVLAEATPAAPVFSTPGPGQIFVRMLDAYRGKDAAGNIVDFHSDLEVSRGDQVVRCTATVNDPCHAFGYKVHQAAFFDDIARLRITGPGGRLLYDDVLDFEGQATAVPALRVTGAGGAVLFDQPLPQMGTDPGAAPGREDDVALGLLSFPSAPGASQYLSYPVSWKVVDGKLRLAVSGPDLPLRELAEGEEAVAGPYRIRYEGARSIPAIAVADMPGSAGGATVQMPADTAGRPYLFVSGLEADATSTVLLPGQALSATNGYTYTFGGPVEASGVSVKRDPGDTFIWVAVGMAVVGLGITFYVPRRRLWVKVTPNRTFFAGVAERTTRLGRELRLMGADLGSRDALRPEDRE